VISVFQTFREEKKPFKNQRAVQWFSFTCERHVVFFAVTYVEFFYLNRRNSKTIRIVLLTYLTMKGDSCRISLLAEVSHDEARETSASRELPNLFSNTVGWAVAGNGNWHKSQDSQ